MASNKIAITEQLYQLTESLTTILFPEIKPYNSGYLEVSQLHSLYYAEYGNRGGIPVLFLHGGPGGGVDDNDARYFDPEYYRIILFDQRGTMKSKPFGELIENTPQHAVNDIEKLRTHLNIDKWIIFGGSYGSFLAIYYAEHHPTKVISFVLRGICLGTKPEYESIWYGMQDIFPDLWDDFVKFLPEDERADLMTSYYKRLLHPNPEVHMEAARSFIKYDMSAAYLLPDQTRIGEILADDRLVLGCARIFTHYAVNNFFVKDNELLDNISKIQHLPAIIIQGRYDMLCRAKTAYNLHIHWPGSELIIVSDAGHSAYEPGIARELVRATERLKGILLLA